MSTNSLADVNMSSETRRAYNTAILLIPPQSEGLWRTENWLRLSKKLEPIRRIVQRVALTLSHSGGVVKSKWNEESFGRWTRSFEDERYRRFLGLQAIFPRWPKSVDDLPSALFEMRRMHTPKHVGQSVMLAVDTQLPQEIFGDIVSFLVSETGPILVATSVREFWYKTRGEHPALTRTLVDVLRQDTAQLNYEANAPGLTDLNRATAKFDAKHRGDVPAWVAWAPSSG